MFQSIHSVAICGVDGVPVRVEADIRDGFPSFEMLGYLSSQVKEAGGRVRSALYNSGFPSEPKRICINLAPANVKKDGNGFDLPIAVAILATLIPMCKEQLEHTMFAGELGLDGSVKRIPGMLSMVCAAKKAGLACCVVPKENEREALVLSGVSVIGVTSLREVVDWLTGKRPETDHWLAGDKDRNGGTADNSVCSKKIPSSPVKEELPDFADVFGQQSIKRAIEIAVSGWHNFLMIGAAGSGKTMLARRIPGIMPPLDIKEQLELSRIYSVSGLLNEERVFMQARPFRAPHHTVTRVALSGGGKIPKAGEISLAHHGVLFLDELPEFSLESMEALRQPIEEHQITVVRNYGTVVYPAHFLLVAAMNPCKCGYYPNRTRCHCNEAQIRKYLNRISGPLLDRIDLVSSVEPVKWEELEETSVLNNESSEQIQKRVWHTWELQQERFQQENIRCNSQMNQRQMERYCQLGKSERRLMQEAFERFGISVRVYHKILKVARTIADMGGSSQIREEHLSEAIYYRSAVRHFWNER